MTATLAPPATAPTGGTGSRGRRGTVAGTATLVRFILRRDRIRLPVWLFALTMITFYYANALPAVIGDGIDEFGLFMEGPVGALMSGPGYGSDDLTIPRAVVGVYGLYYLLAAALMNILLVSRHTRAEEQTGRSELLRASVVGRHAPLTATLIVAVLANVLLSLLIGAAMAVSFDGGAPLLFGAGIGAVGLVFAGITALTAQVSEYSRAGSGIAGAALGAAYVIRGAGDMLGADSNGSLLSWFSPLAWSQQTRAYVDGRWWPLLLAVGFAAVAAAAGYLLSTRRDVGAGLVAPRRGRAHAAQWLRSPLALGFRLQRASLLWWMAALMIGALLYGAIAQPIVDAFEGVASEELLAVMGGDPANMLGGYLSVIALVDALLVGVFVILGIVSLRGEETRGRAEPVLATATGRLMWCGSYLTVLAGGAVALLLVTGAGFGVSTAISTGDAEYLGDMVVAHLAYLPAVLVLLGIAALLFGVAPRAVGATWAVLGYGFFMGFFGQLMEPPQWLLNLSPLDHIARVPLEELAWTPLVILTGLAAGLLALGLAGFRRRDLDTK